MDLGIADDALLDVGAAGLELRLDERDQPGRWLRQRQRRRQHQLEGDEAYVDDHETGWRHELVRRQ